MNEIKKVSVEDADKFVLGNKLWGFNSYDAEVYAQIAYDDEAFTVRFTVKEACPPCRMKQHFDKVDKDSCVEFFVNFMPGQSDKYINFEVNALGFMNASLRSNVYDGVQLTLEDIEGLHITPEVHEAYWTVTYRIGFDFLQKYYPGFDIGQCDYLLGNLYKCGSWTENKHYLSYFKIETEQTNFHRPDYFGKLILDKKI